MTKSCIMLFGGLALSLAGHALERAASNPYGVCAHLTKNEFEDRERIVNLVAGLGVGSIRFDCPLRSVIGVNGEWHFDRVDAVVDAICGAGLEPLPILAFPGTMNKRGKPPAHWPPDSPENEAYWTNYVYQTVSRYKGRVRTWEIMNEPNIHGYDAPRYFAVLKSAYTAIKRADPTAKVATGGFAGIPAEMLEELYALGAARYFDIMNVHLYATHDIRYAPEGNFDARLEALRKLMSSQDDGHKPVWLTETGSPTHRESAAAEGKRWNADVLKKAIDELHLPPQARRVLVVGEVPVSGELEAGGVDLVRDTLGSGYSVAPCRPGEVAVRVKAKEADILFLSFNWLHFQVDYDAVEQFVKDGGTLVVCGGTPLMNELKPREGGGWQSHCDLAGTPSEDLPRRFRFPVGNFLDAKVNRSTLKFPSATPPLALAGRYFLTGDGLKEGDRITPVISARAPDGREFMQVAVLKFNSDWKGAVVVSCLHNRFWFPRTEEQQAIESARILGLVAAEGVERVFLYEFKANETAPDNSQDHFGVVHSDLSPKAAFHAWRQFVRMRPAGATNLPGEWRAEDHALYFPTWVRPDGREAGMMWSVAGKRTRYVDGGEVSFFDLYGKPTTFPLEGTRYKVTFGSSPVYFVRGSNAR